MTIKRVFFSIITTLALCAAFSLHARAQTGMPPSVYRQPARLALNRLIRARFPEFYNQAFHGEMLIIEQFYPIGWSKDGKFAYYVEPGDEACGCYFAKLFIIDLVTDKVLWTFDYDSSAAEDRGAKHPPSTISALWRANQKLFSAKLREHNIVPQPGAVLLPFPIVQGGDQLRADLKIKENKEEETRAYGIVAQATLQLISKRGERKTIFDRDYVKPDDVLPLAVKVMGYLKSPFEPRVAIMLTEIYRGYEGPPNTTNVEIVGASLGSGFK